MRKYYRKTHLVGIRKEFDNLNRIVIPKEMRDLYKFGKEVEMIATPDGVLIRSPEWRLTKVLNNKR